MSSDNRDLRQEAIAFSYILHMMAVSGDESKLNEMSISDLADFCDYMDYAVSGAKNALYIRLILAGHTNLSHCREGRIINAVHDTWHTLHDEESDWIVTMGYGAPQTKLLSQQFLTTRGGGFVVAYLREGGAMVLDPEKRTKASI